MVGITGQWHALMAWLGQRRTSGTLMAVTTVPRCRDVCCREECCREVLYLSKDVGLFIGRRHDVVKSALEHAVGTADSQLCAVQTLHACPMLRLPMNEGPYADHDLVDAFGVGALLLR